MIFSDGRVHAPRCSHHSGRLYPTVVMQLVYASELRHFPDCMNGALALRETNEDVRLDLFVVMQLAYVRRTRTRALAALMQQWQLGLGTG